MPFVDRELLTEDNPLNLNRSVNGGDIGYRRVDINRRDSGVPWGNGGGGCVVTHIREQYLVTIEENGDLVVLETHTTIHPEVRLPPRVWNTPENWFLQARSQLQGWINYKTKELSPP